jgi:hypothetical protein
MFTPDTAARLRSGQSLGLQWKHLNGVGESARFTSAETVATRDAMGRNPRVLRTPVGGGGSSWNYRGMYDPAVVSPYMNGDVVQMGSGTSAGMYFSTIDNNNNAPDSGIGWIQISTGSGSYL